MIVLGLPLGVVGTDITSGTQRFCFGIPELADGIGFVPLAMGLFGISEIIKSLERKEKHNILSKLSRLWMTRRNTKAADAGRGSRNTRRISPGDSTRRRGYPCFVHILHAGKKDLSDPGSFGKGNICGVASPESANNAAAANLLRASAHTRHTAQCRRWR